VNDNIPLIGITVPTTLGVIGGMGPLATTAFHRLIVLNTVATRDQDHVPVIIDSDPRIPDRTEYLLGRGADPRPALNLSARRLAAAGAQHLVMPCNTANVFADEVAAASGLPVIPWMDIAVDAVLADRRQGGHLVAGLLGTTGTLRVGLYTRMFRARDADVIEPGAEDQEAVMAAIYAIDGVKAAGSASAARQSDLLRVADDLANRGADALLLACTELPLAIAPTDPRWPLPVIDPALEVARRAVSLAGGLVTPPPAQHGRPLELEW
jgi:aspartate racemase